MARRADPIDVALEFVDAGTASPRWSVARVEHPVVALDLALSRDDHGELLAALSFSGRGALEAQARRCGARLVDEAGESRAATQLREYFAGEREHFALRLLADPRASDFEREAWAALTRIPFGETRSYAEQARMLGKPGAARAVGRANARNPLPVVVPCHRIIGADGSLTGFAGGLERKRWLLAHEGVRLGPKAGAALPAPQNQLGLF